MCAARINLAWRVINSIQMDINCSSVRWLEEQDLNTDYTPDTHNACMRIHPELPRPGQSKDSDWFWEGNLICSVFLFHLGSSLILLMTCLQFESPCFFCPDLLTGLLLAWFWEGLCWDDLVGTTSDIWTNVRQIDIGFSSSRGWKVKV